MPSPKKNTQHSVVITKWASKGLATGHIEDTPIHAPYTAPGDTITAHITKSTPHIAYAKALSIDSPSPHRVDPPCDIFGKCGGCQIQHVAYPEQLRYKTELVENILHDHAIPHPPISITQSQQTQHYRNKSQFEIQYDEHNRPIIGLSAPRSQRIIDCPKCEIQHPLTNQVLSIVKHHLSQDPLPLTHLVTRVAINTQQLMVALVSNKPSIPTLDPLINALQGIPELTSLYFNHNSNAKWTVLGDTNTLLYGSPVITETIAGLTLELSLHSFFQANTSLIKTMWHKITAILNPKPTDIILDLYAGTGSLSLHLAKQIKYMIGIESNADAIRNAKRNAKLNQITNTRFILGTVEDTLPSLTDTPDAIIVDPPRKGVSESALNAIITIKPKKIVYISCAPDTLARDLTVLTQHGYTITTIECLDMFPQTYHVETITLLERI